MEQPNKTETKSHTHKQKKKSTIENKCTTIDKQYLWL